MKAKFFVVLLAALLSYCFICGGADTNFYPVLKIGSQTYTNVHIGQVTPGDAIVFFDGGGARIALSNFPSWLQSRLNYHPKKAVQYLQQQQQKQQQLQQQEAAAQKALVAKELAARGPVENIKIEKMISDQFLITTEDGKQIQAYVKLLPADIQQGFDQQNQLSKAIDTLAAKIEHDDRALRYESAWDPISISDPNYNDLETLRADVLNEAGERLTDERQHLDKLKDQLSKIQADTASKNITKAFFTGKLVGQTQIWECVPERR